MKIREDRRLFYIYDLIPILYFIFIYFVSTDSKDKKIYLCNLVFILYFLARQVILVILYDDKGKRRKTNKYVKWRR